MTEYTQAQPHCMDPWTPVSVSRSDDDVTVGVWGRTYRFVGGPLPSGIATAGREVLAAPVRLVGELDGSPIEWSDAGRRMILHGHDDGQATLLGCMRSVCGKLIVNTAVRVEFDGAMFIDVKIMPGGGPEEEQVLQLTRLLLEAPLRTQSAELFHYWPQVDMGTGPDFSVSNSGAVPADGLALPFKPFLWLGWEEGGLACFAESDRDWNAAGERAIEVVRDRKATTLRLHLLDDEPPAWRDRKPVWRHRIRPLVFRMGLQGTPVKPMPADPFGLRVDFESSHHVADSSTKDSSGKSELDAIIERGVNTLALHEGWQPLQNYGWSDELDEVRAAVEVCHNRGLKVWAYFGYELTTLAPEWGEYADDWLVENTDGVPAGGWRRRPHQRDYIVCSNTRWQDLLVERISRIVETCRFDGLYLDQTNTPFGCANESHGCGFRDDDGRLHVSFPIRAARNVMKRLYDFMHRRGGHIEVHQSSGCVIPTMAFAHSYFDGEHLIWHDKFKNDPSGSIGLAAFRAEFTGRNFGIPAEFMAAPDSQAFPMLHGVLNRPLGRHADNRTPLWRVLDEFGVAQADWHPYWRNTCLLDTSHDTVKASAYLRRDAQQVRMLLIVANIAAHPGDEAASYGREKQSKDMPLATKLTVNFDELGAVAESAGVVDALTGEPVTLVKGKIPLALGPLDFRLLILSADKIGG